MLHDGLFDKDVTCEHEWCWCITGTSSQVDHHHCTVTSEIVHRWSDDITFKPSSNSSTVDLMRAA